ncbi:M1 family metallopeptidase [Paenibacillus sp. BSR1-1]|uniref:M1 family metallopeptidase n=1 Tax=Paenibacillus sp. BSR1-1 TaxID=3020845 RepID=UPI0025B1C141|nr:M1 family metallopeptidase [Paenibacillus sp. BSR1-1]MDN3019611.1 M1 family metallopeptidase [Paenibacillus sp. BSR1-1]
MKYFIWVMALLVVLSGCESQVNGNQAEKTKGKKAEPQKVVQKEQLPVEEKVAFKHSTPVKMDPSLPLESLATFKPNARPNENKAKYDLKVKAEKDGLFQVTANIQVENLSADNWEDLVFHFIPNYFTEKNKPVHLQSAAEVHIWGIQVAGKTAQYNLEKDTLQILLNESLKPKENVPVTVTYSFKLPENGARFSQVMGKYYLAEWYPLVSTYRSGWDKADFSLHGESYHTDFSDFTIQYDIPEEYTIVSSADDDPKELATKGTITGSNMKEVYMAIVKGMPMKSAVVDGTEIRVFSNRQDEAYEAEYLELAKKALQFFNANIGKYPHKQLDIIMDESGMEYPGIVTVAQGNTNEFAVVHEMAHQWFYGTVSSNPSYTPWIDEGTTNFATYLFFIKNEKQAPADAFAAADDHIKMAKDKGKIVPSNYSLKEFEPENMLTYSASVYEIPSLKLWALSGNNADRALDYLKNYYRIYAYKEVDANEWLRFTRAYFKIKDPKALGDWISF